MSPSAPVSRPRWRSLVAGLSVALLVGAGAAPAQAETILIWDGSNAEFDLIVTTGGQSEWLYNVEVTNLTSETQYLGFGADLRQQGVTDYFWEESLPFSQEGRAVVEPGATQFVTFLPAWSGMTYSFFSSIDTTPQLIGEFVVPGRYLPFDLRGEEGVDENGDITPGTLEWQAGYPVVALPSVARAGELLRIEAFLGADWPLGGAEVWIGENVGYNVEDAVLRGLVGFEENFLAGVTLTAGMTLLGTLPANSDAIAGSLLLPPDLTEGSYRLLVGDSGSGLWPAGPTLSLNSGLLPDVTIEAGPPRGATEPDTEMPVTPLDQFGATPVSFTFDEVTTGGTTSVTTSTSGPASTAFTLLGGVNAVYYELETTAGFAGPVTVCLSYDPTGLSEAQQNAIALFHYTGGTWSNITTTRSPGQVCGETDSFSPFALGIPNLQYDFQGFLNPVSNTAVNQQFAGTIVPIRFRLGGDQGLDVIASGSPTTGVTACTVGATPATSQPAVAATSTPLTYVASTETYWYLWKTDKGWAGTCQQFSVTLDDGSVHTATFKFTKLTLGSLLRAIIRAI